MLRRFVRGYRYLRETEAPDWVTNTLFVLAVLILAFALLPAIGNLTNGDQESSRQGIQWVGIIAFGVALARALFIAIAKKTRNIASASVMVSGGFTVLGGPAAEAWLDQGTMLSWVQVGLYVVGVLFAIAALEASRLQVAVDPSEFGRDNAKVTGRPT